MTGQYAKGTEVSVGRTRDEIERILERFGASRQAWMRDDEKGVTTIAFIRERKTYKFSIKIPSLSEFMETPSRRFERSEADAKRVQDAEMRRRFRSLANYIKALLDAIDTGIIQLEEALLPYLVLSQGRTFYEEAQVALKAGGDINLPRLGPGGEK